MRHQPFSILVVAIVVTALAVVNWGFLEAMRRDSELRSTLYYERYVEARSVMLSPTFLVADLAFICLGMWWVFKRRQGMRDQEWRKIRDAERLIVFAMMLGNIYGLALLYFVPL